MIPPRLRQILVRLFLSDYVIDSGKKKGYRRVSLDGGMAMTANYRATDLRTLERKGFITYERNETMSELWGVSWFNVTLAEGGREELAEEFARRCAEADEANARLDAPIESVDEIDERRADMADRADARARQRAAKT